MSGHTPGPWKYGSHFIEGADGGTVVCADSGMKVADARLIHAAPDMLEALLMAQARFAELHNSPTTLSFVSAAIAKATGKPKP